MAILWTGSTDADEVLGTLFGQSPIGVAFHDDALRFAYVNATLGALVGFDAAGAVGRSLPEVAPAFAPTIVPLLERVLQRRQAVVGRPFPLADRHCVGSFYPVCASGGEVIGVGSVVFDDSAQQRARTAVRDIQARYRTLVDMSPDAIMVVDEEATIAYANAALASMLGEPGPSALVGRSGWDFVSPTNRTPGRAIFAGLLETPSPTSYDLRFVRSDGTTLIASATSAPFVHAGRRGVQSVLRDVTTERAAERDRARLMDALDAERQRLDAVLQQLPAGVVVLGEDGRLVLANAAAERIWGAPGPDEATDGEDAWSVRLRVGEEVVLPGGGLLARALHLSEYVEDVPIVLRCADGQVRTLRGTASPIVGPDGRRRGAVGTFWDVSPLARSEDDLRHAHDELERRVAERTAALAEANERLRHEATVREAAERGLRVAERLASIGTFTAGVAHEISNPLAAIVAATELARVIAAEGDPRRELDGVLQRVVEEAHRGGEIVKGLLRFASDAPTERWPVDVVETVGRVCGSAQGLEIARECELVVRAPRRALRVVVNPTELEQVVLNLLRNALQAGARRIVIGVRARPGGVRVSVKDDGRGIRREDVERIFDPFFTTRAGDGGTGLGLSIVHGIVTGFGGRIGVRSRVGEGTLFTVDLPIGPRSEALTVAG